MARFVILFVLWVMGLNGCATIDPPPEEITQGIKIPYEMSPEGHYLIPVSINELAPSPFIIDTAATVSAIFFPALQDVEELYANLPTTNVRGLVKTVERPVVFLDTLKISDYVSENHRIVLLPEQQDDDMATGLIGLDVLSQFVVVVDPETQTITLLNPESFDRKPYERWWSKISLTQNPYGFQRSDLRFAKAYSNSLNIPVLIDTGASDTMMNWVATREMEPFRRLQKRLREEWVINGANGEFRPNAIVTIKDITVGDYVWSVPNPVIVAEINSLFVGGKENRPLMILGADLLRDKTYILDLQRNALFIKPSEEE
ncbi:MAG: aspartyl protease family protein [Pseudomonadota bacterium]